MKKEKKILSPNILLTNLCNQNCSYCFAKKEMKENKTKEMSLADFKKLTKILRKNGIATLRLMGGEPTLHSRFEEIIKLALKEFAQILIFTNGLMPIKARRVIERNLERIGVNFNLDTPSFENDPQKRKEIISLIEKFAPYQKTNIGFTLSDLEKDYLKLFKGFKEDIWQRVGIRFGLAKQNPGERPFFTKEDYLKIGAKIVILVESFKKMGIKDIFLDCGLKKEMFTYLQKYYLSNNVHLRGWGCEGKWSSFDITPDLLLFICFSFYKKKVPIKKIKDFYDFQKFFPKQNCFKE